MAAGEACPAREARAERGVVGRRRAAALPGGVKKRAEERVAAQPPALELVVRLPPLTVLL